jgi:alpha-tubulin suppressor-like RCC1 family protein
MAPHPSTAINRDTTNRPMALIDDSIQDYTFEQDRRRHLVVLQLHRGAGHHRPLSTPGRCRLESSPIKASLLWTAEPGVMLGAYRAVAAGKDYTCGLKQDGSIACWGLNNKGQTTPPAP